LYPTDVYEEGVANMISDGVSDLLSGIIKMAYEKDETKKVLFKGNEPMSCIF